MTDDLPTRGPVRERPVKNCFLQDPRNLPDRTITLFWKWRVYGLRGPSMQGFDGPVATLLGAATLAAGDSDRVRAPHDFLMSFHEVSMNFINFRT